MIESIRPTIRGICLELEFLGAAYLLYGPKEVGEVLLIFAGIRAIAGIYVAIKCGTTITTIEGKMGNHKRTTK